MFGDTMVGIADQETSKNADRIIRPDLGIDQTDTLPLLPEEAQRRALIYGLSWYLNRWQILSQLETA